MQIFISGGSGYIGTCLSRYLLSQGHKVIAAGSRRNHFLDTTEHFTYIRADTTRQGVWQEMLKSCDTVINLAGRTIFRHWTDRYKEQIYRSRVLTTQNIAAALPTDRPLLFISASAVGYYGDRQDEILAETASAGEGFLCRLAIDWEAAAMAAENDHIRVVTTRFGVIFSRDGGAMSKMIPAFKFFMGGPLGDGKQWYPWMHIEDLTAAMGFIMDHPQIRGPVNFCSPRPVRNRELTRMLARALARPVMPKVPPFVLRLLLGEFGETLLASQRVIPEKLSQNGFEFKFDRIEKAIVEMVRSQENPY